MFTLKWMPHPESVRDEIDLILTGPIVGLFRWVNDTLTHKVGEHRVAVRVPRIEHTQWDEEFDLVPSFSRYMNGRLALQLYMTSGEPFCTISVNLPGDQLYTDTEMFVKNYAENEQIVKTLLLEGWLAPTTRHARSGHATVPVMSLAGDLLKWYDFLAVIEVQ